MCCQSHNPLLIAFNNHNCGTKICIRQHETKYKHRRQEIIDLLTEFTETFWLRLRVRFKYKSLDYPSFDRVEIFSQNVAHAPSLSHKWLFFKHQKDYILPNGRGSTLPMKGLTNHKHDCLILSSKSSQKSLHIWPPKSLPIKSLNSILSLHNPRR
jgi:hypothetical protein